MPSGRIGDAGRHRPEVRIGYERDSERQRRFPRRRALVRHAAREALKYVRPLIPDLEELYDLSKDPDELNNLAVKPEHQATLKRLRAATIAELKRTKAGFVDNMPAVREPIPAKA